ncbi:MAG TPA: hypothetical protein DCO79_13770 [Spirochaeta sp.]|nr:hypothetical protein [Spirochaeta sp.]
MNRNKKIFTAFGLVLAVLMICTAPLAAQNRANPTAFLVYYDDDFELEVFDSTGDYIGEVFMGMELFPGSTIKTYNTSAEIQLDPNGSILKISENSVFQIEAFQTAADESNDFSLFNGKLRVIAARAGLGYENYSIITQSAVCGVRGTDFVIDSIGVVAVKDGAVEFSSLLTGDTVNVLAGQIADVFAETFKAISASAQSLSSVFGGMDFKGTDPGQVPGHTPVLEEPEPEPEPEPEAEAGDPADDTPPEESDDAAGDDTDDGTDDAAQGDDDGTQDDGTQVENEETAGTVTTEEPVEAPKPARTGSAAAFITGDPRPDPDRDEEAETEDKEPEEEKEPGPVELFFDDLGDMLGFEIGSILIDGNTYAKAVVQPEFEIGKFKAKFYLPVIYQDNLFDPQSWYHPAGNNEWSFGTDPEFTEPVDIAFDILNDIFLKINYLQWGDNGDDFYLKFGNLDNMTIGHGILMRNFSNNIEFPAVRKVGLNTGVNFEKFGFEAVLDNAASPTIFGGRLVYIPFGSEFPMSIGLSAVTDINPDSELETSTVLWDPMVLNGAFDIGFPIEPINMTIFAETAGLIVYDDAAWHAETFYNQDQPDFGSALNNFGVVTGIYGNILSLDYRLEYRLSKGIFTPGFYANNYLINKTTQYNALTAYIADPLNTDYQKYTMGIYGDLSMNFFDAVVVSGGYLWPWQIAADGTVDFSADDFFSLSAALMPDVIPVIGLHGSVSYMRTGLVNSIKEAASGTEDFQLFTQESIFAGELVYPFDPSLDIAMQFATAYTRDAFGNLFTNPDGSLDTYFALSIDMRVHF